MKQYIQRNLWVGMIFLLLPLCQYLSGFIAPYAFMIIIQAGINAILAVSLNLVSGLAGQFSLGHAGFMAVGAYSSAYLTHILGATSILSFTCALLTGGGLAAFFGWLVGLPSLRLRGDYLAIVTLGFGEIIRVLILNTEALGGARGLSGIAQQTTFAWVFGALAITLIIIGRLRNSSYGRALQAIREDEIAAESLGLKITRYKVLAFVLAAGFAGVAGGLFAHYFSYISPPSFGFMKSFEIIIMVVLGGMGSMSGSVIAAFFVTLLPELLRPLQNITGVDLRLVLYSLLLIIMMLVRPHGLMGQYRLQQVLYNMNKRFGYRG